MKNKTIRDLGRQLGIAAYKQGLSCIPQADDFYTSKVRYMYFLHVKNFTSGWLEGWRSADLDSSGGW